MSTTEERCPECNKKLLWHLTSGTLPSPQVQAENEAICERLLGWAATRGPLMGTAWPVGGAWIPTPTFLTWSEAGLILEALQKAGRTPSLEVNDGQWDCYGNEPYNAWFHARADTAPAAVRAAALAYLGAQK